MQIRYLEYFIQVVECGSINKAAQRLFVSPQTISSVISRMEQELGTTLLFRHSGGSELTEAGVDFLKDAKQIVEIANGWFRYKKKADLYGQVHLYTSFVCCTSLSRLIIHLQADNPEMRATIHERRSMEALEELGHHRAAVAVVSFVIEEEQDFERKIEEIGFEKRLILEDELCVTVSAKNPAFADKKSLTWEECKKVRLLLSSDAEDQIGKRFFPGFQTGYPLQLKNHASIMNLVLENKGVVLLPWKMTKQEPLYRAGTIRLLPISGMDMRQNHYMIRQKNLPQKSLEFRISEIIADYYQSGEW